MIVFIFVRVFCIRNKFVLCCRRCRPVSQFVGPSQSGFVFQSVVTLSFPPFFGKCEDKCLRLGWWLKLMLSKILLVHFSLSLFLVQSLDWAWVAELLLSSYACVCVQVCVCACACEMGKQLGYIRFKGWITFPHFILCLDFASCNLRTLHIRYVWNE